MSSALPGMHYCLEHQGNHAHYSSHNCVVCELKAECDKYYQWHQNQLAATLKAEAEVRTLKEAMSKVTTWGVVLDGDLVFTGERHAAEARAFNIGDGAKVIPLCCCSTDALRKDAPTDLSTKPSQGT